MRAFLIAFLVAVFQPPVANAIICPNATFVPLGTYCVMYMGPTLYNQTTAQSKCAAINSSLATFLNPAEQSAFSFIKTVTTGRIYVGYYNNGIQNGPSNPGIWYDQYGTKCLYIGWGTGEPNSGGWCQCGSMWNYNGVYAVNDDDCANNMYPVICMWRPYPIPSNCIITTTTTSTPSTTTTSTSNSQTSFTTTTTPTTSTTSSTETTTQTQTSTTKLPSATLEPTADSFTTTSETSVVPQKSVTVASANEAQYQLLKNANVDLLPVLIGIISGSVLISCLCCVTTAGIWRQSGRKNPKSKSIATQT